MEIIISFVSGAVAFILVRGIVMILGMEKKIKELQALVDSLITNVERRDELVNIRVDQEIDRVDRIIENTYSYIDSRLDKLENKLSTKKEVLKG